MSDRGFAEKYMSINTFLAVKNMFTDRRHSLNFYSKQLVLICLINTHACMELNLIIVNKKHNCHLSYMGKIQFRFKNKLIVNSLKNKAIVLIQKQI